MIQDSGANNIAVGSQVAELDSSMKIASKVSSLMDLESKILSMIKGISADYEYWKRCLESYKRRLNQVDKMINDAMSHLQ